MVDYKSGSNEKPRVSKNRTREILSRELLRYSMLLISITIVGMILLISLKAIDADNAITIILAVANIFTGLLGSAIAYYFSSTK